MTEPVKTVPARQAFTIYTVLGCVIAALAVGITLMSGLVKEARDANADTDSSASACRAWDIKVVDGTLATTMGTVRGVAEDTTKNSAKNPAEVGPVYQAGFNDFIATVGTLSAHADVARAASQIPDVDPQVYRALRDMAVALDGTRKDSIEGYVLNVLKVQLPLYEEALFDLKTACGEYV